MKKRADWPCRSPGRGRLSADERLRVEGLLEHVVYRLEGKGSDRFVSFSSMLRRGVTMETVASALMLRRGGKARVYFEDAVSMLGQIARRINSYLLPRIVALRLDLDRQWRSWNGNAPDKAGTRRLVDEFAHCHDALFAEVGFLDVRERVKIWPRASGRSPDWQMLVEVLQSFTTLAYCEFSDMDLYFRDDSDPAEDGADVGMDIANEDTEEKHGDRPRVFRPCDEILNLPPCAGGAIFDIIYLQFANLRKKEHGKA